MPSIDVVASRLRALRRNLPLLIGNEVVLFALDNFDREAFNQGNTQQKWPDRKDVRPGKLLVGKGSGVLRRSVRVLRHNASSVTVGSDVKYAGIHNEGGTILVPVTAKSRKFFWAMYKKTGLDKWKYLALTKKKRLKIEMPERRFIGPSAALDKRIARLIERQLEKCFNAP